MKQIFLMCICLSITWVSQGAVITMTGTDVGGTTSFNTGNKWPDGLAPVAGNDYRTGGNSMRTPDTGTTKTPFVFAGDSLTLNGGGIGWKSFGPITITNLIVDGGSMTASSDNCFGDLYGNLTINAGKTFSITASEPNPRGFNIHSTISGTGNIQLQMNQVTSLKQTFFFGNNTGFSGKINLRGLGKFGICAEEALGANPTTFAANQLEFDGTTLIATNSLTLDDPNRGIRLNNTLNAGSHIYPGGVFEVVGSSSTATVSCVISGAGPLTKRGTGTLILGTNSTYQGTTTIEGGTLRFTSKVVTSSAGIAVAGATACVAGEGVLPGVALSNGGQILAENSGWDMPSLSAQDGILTIDLANADPDTAMIRVSGTLSKSPFTVFQISAITNNLIETPYKVLSAPNLSDFSDVDFCVSPPWLGELSFADDGLGGQVLLLTPTPPEKIIFKTIKDDFGETAFTNTKWSDSLPPTGEKTYVIQGHEMRTPPSGNNTFPGERLICDGNNMSLKGTGTATITDLTLMNNATFGMAEHVASYLAGNIRLHPVLAAGKVYALTVNGWSNLRDLYLYSTLSGYGDVLLITQGDPAAGTARHILTGNNTNYFGRINVRGNSNFWVRVTCEENFGGVPPAFRADQLSFNGGGISVTNNVTIDDLNRGIMLRAEGGTASTSSDPGSYPTNSLPADRRFEGGCSLRPENSAVLTIFSPITGPGALIKNGSGLLVLGGNNTYAGRTEIVAGTLEPLNAGAIGTGPLLLRPAGRLLRRYPGTGMPNGVELGGPITFETGSAVRVELEEGQRLSGSVPLPLFLLAEGQTIEAAAVPVEHAFANTTATVSTSTVGTRVLVSVQFKYQGSLIILR